MSRFLVFLALAVSCQAPSSAPAPAALGPATSATPAVSPMKTGPLSVNGNFAMIPVGSGTGSNTPQAGSAALVGSIDVGAGVFVEGGGNGPGLCAPTAGVTPPSGPHTPFYFSPGSDCPGFPHGYSVLDLDLTNGDVTVDGLDPGENGQVLWVVNEGGANLYLWNNVNSLGFPFQLPNFHQAWLAVTESSWVMLKFGPDRYGDEFWNVVAQSDNALEPPRDLALGSAFRATVSSCGTGGHVIDSGSWSGIVATGTGATGCLLTINLSNASGGLNCVFSAESGAPIAYTQGSCSPSVIWPSGAPVSCPITLAPGTVFTGWSFSSQTIHYHCVLSDG